MDSPEVIHAIQSVGDGTGQVRPEEITPEDISVRVRRVYEASGSDTTGIEVSVFLDEETIRQHASVHGSPEETAEYDAIVTIAGAPLPETASENAAAELSIDITVEQVRQAVAAQCPRCRSDLRRTLEEDRCTACGFGFE